MCGIAGIIKLDRDDSYNITEKIVSMADTIRHRGPDDEGYVLFSNKISTSFAGKDTPEAVLNHKAIYTPSKRMDAAHDEYQVAFAHRRLAIIDLSPFGHQPYCDEGKKVWITYNGEIYNYIELREELKAMGYIFITNTDVEVLCKAYSAWGMDCVHHFNGMWAFVLYDLKKNIIFGSRDRTGVKPLYYRIHPKCFVFGSEQKALLQAPYAKKLINHDAVFDFFIFNTLETNPEGMFKGIIELIPSHSFSLSLSSKEFKTWKYFSPKINLSSKKGKTDLFIEHCKKTNELIFDAVKLRLRSDVPVGACLSGGIDSSSIVCIINELEKLKENKPSGLKRPVFTSCFDDPVFDESKWAGKVARFVHAEWHKTYPSEKGLLSDLEELTYCQDIPFRSTSTYAQFRVMKLASDNGIKVMLDGQGADEMFGGYKPHFGALLLNAIKQMRYKKVLKQIKGYDENFSAGMFLRNHYLKHILSKKLPSLVRKNAMTHYYNELHYLAPDFIETYKERFASQQREVYGNSLNRMLSYEYSNHPLKELLKCEDRCSMWHSIESRTPFADDLPLMQYLFSVQENYKLYNGESKSILRHAMEGILPDEIRNRRDKMGYLTPNNLWISQLKDFFIPYFKDDKSGILNTRLILKDFNNLFERGQEMEDYRLFGLISFVVWLSVFKLK